MSNCIWHYRKSNRCTQVLIMIFYFAEVVELCVTDATNKPYSALKIQLEGKHECITEYWDTELVLNRGVNLFGPIRRQDTKIGGCHLAFFPPLLWYRGKGWIAGLVKKVITSECSPRLKLFPIIWVDWPIGTPLFSPAPWLWTLLTAQCCLSFNQYYRLRTLSKLVQTAGYPRMRGKF